MSASAITKIEKHIKDNNTEEIVLDDINIGVISDELKKKLEKIEDMSILCMNNCNLKTLANFPNLENIIRLELSSNPFPASDLVHLNKLKDLQSLSINDNNIKSIDDLKVLKDLSIAQLDLTGTELAKQDNYRDKVFELLDELQILDNKDKEGNDIEYDEEEYDDEDEFDDDEDEFDDDEDEDGFDDEDDDEDDEDDEDDDDKNGDELKNKKTKL